MLRRSNRSAGGTTQEDRQRSSGECTHQFPECRAVAKSFCRQGLGRVRSSRGRRKVRIRGSLRRAVSLRILRILRAEASGIAGTNGRAPSKRTCSAVQLANGQCAPQRRYSFVTASGGFAFTNGRKHTVEGEREGGRPVDRSEEPFRRTP